jgi:hypothetical protein
MKEHQWTQKGVARRYGKNQGNTGVCARFPVAERLEN